MVPTNANVAKAKMKVKEAAKIQLCGIEIGFSALYNTPPRWGSPSLVIAYLHPGPTCMTPFFIGHPLMLLFKTHVFLYPSSCMSFKIDFQNKNLVLIPQLFILKIF